MDQKTLFGDSNDARSKVRAPSSGFEMGGIVLLLVILALVMLL
jgi:hypothetical protein